MNQSALVESKECARAAVAACLLCREWKLGEMMFTFDYEFVSKTVTAVGCVVGAVWIAWRERVYLGFQEFSMVGPVMCAIAVVTLLLTALAVICRREELPEE